MQRKIYVLFNESQHLFIRSKNPLKVTSYLQFARVFSRKCDAANAKSQGRMSYIYDDTVSLKDFNVIELICEIK